MASKDGKRVGKGTAPGKLPADGHTGVANKSSPKKNSSSESKVVASVAKATKTSSQSSLSELKSSQEDVKPVSGQKKSREKPAPTSSSTAQAQPYKQRHNIGRRVAAERVGSYNETDMAECYPGVGSARLLCGNLELVSGSEKTDRSESVVRHAEEKGKSHQSENLMNDKTDKSKKSSRSEQSSAATIEEKTDMAKKNKVVTSEKSKRQSKPDDKESLSVVYGAKKSTKSSKAGTDLPKKITTSIPPESSCATNGGTQDSAKALEVESKSDTSSLHGSKAPDVKETASSTSSVKKPIRQTNANVASQMSKAVQNKSSERESGSKLDEKVSSKGKSSLSKGVNYDSEPEAPRGKRMARLNAEVIMSLMTEKDDVVSQKQPFGYTFSSSSDDSDSDYPSDSSEEDETARSFVRRLSSTKRLPSKKGEKVDLSDDKSDVSRSASVELKPAKKRPRSSGKSESTTKDKSEENSKLEEVVSGSKAVKKEKKRESTNESAPSPPPKRMASLNAQAILAASLDDRLPVMKKQRLSGEALNLVSSSRQFDNPSSVTQTSVVTTHKSDSRHSNEISKVAGAEITRSQENTSSEKRTTDVISVENPVVTSKTSSSLPDVIITATSLPQKSQMASSACVTQESVVKNQSGMSISSGQSRSSSKSHSKHNQSRRSDVEQLPASRSQAGDRPRSSLDSRPSSSTVDATSNVRTGFCQPQIGPAPSQGIGFPVATRLTATVAPSPVRFNVPVIVPQPSVAGYLAAAARQPSPHTYYPYAARANIFAYPVAGYPSSAHSYGSSTVASWSGLQDISQFSYQPALSTSSLCSTEVTRSSSGGVLQQPHQQLPLPSHQQQSNFFNQYFQPVPMQAHQSQTYPNIQPAHSPFGVYPTRFGLVASAPVIPQPGQLSDAVASSAKCFDQRTASFASPSTGASFTTQSSNVTTSQHSSMPASRHQSPSVKSKRSAQSSSTSTGRNESSPLVNSQSQRDQLVKDGISCSGSDSSSPLVKSYYVLGTGTDQRAGVVVTESATITASPIIQPFGIYAGCVSTPFNVSISPGQTSQTMPLGCFQPAGPLIQIPAIWDMQTFGSPIPSHSMPTPKQPMPTPKQPAVPVISTERQHSESSHGAVSAHSSKALGNSGTQSAAHIGPTVVAKGSSNRKSRGKPSAEQSPTPHGSAKKLETAVVTAIQLSTAGQYSSEAQERELDLSRKTSALQSPATVVSATGTVNTVSSASRVPFIHPVDNASSGKAATVSVSSQIGHLEKFVHGTGKSQQLSIEKPSGAQQSSAKKSSKRKLDLTSHPALLPAEDVSAGSVAKRPKHVKTGGVSEENQNSASCGEPQAAATKNIALDDKEPQLVGEGSTAVKYVAVVEPAKSSVIDVTRKTDDELLGQQSTETSALNKLENAVENVQQLESAQCVPVLNSSSSSVPVDSNEVGQRDKSIDLSCTSSSHSGPGVSIYGTSPVPNATKNVDTEINLVSPAKMEMGLSGTGKHQLPISPLASRPKGGTPGSELGKKKRKEQPSSLGRDRKSGPGGEDPVMVEDKGGKVRGYGEDVLAKSTDRKDTGFWEWCGDGEMRSVYTKMDLPAITRMCYPAVRHADGDIICARDCVLVKSGMRKTDIPYVAKIDTFWQDPDTNEMLMSILWYYRLEHTGTDRLPKYVDCEVFASRHRDVIPVACIEDRCYVLTLGEFNRYKAELSRLQHGCPERRSAVPSVPVQAGEQPVLKSFRDSPSRLPDYTVDQGTVFLCRQVYDVKLRRILKNPPAHVSVMQ